MSSAKPSSLTWSTQHFPKIQVVRQTGSWVMTLEVVHVAIDPWQALHGWVSWREESESRPAVPPYDQISRWCEWGQYYDWSNRAHYVVIDRCQDMPKSVVYAVQEEVATTIGLMFDDERLRQALVIASWCHAIGERPDVWAACASLVELDPSLFRQQLITHWDRGTETGRAMRLLAGDSWETPCLIKQTAGTDVWQLVEAIAAELAMWDSDSGVPFSPLVTTEQLLAFLDGVPYEKTKPRLCRG